MMPMDMGFSDVTALGKTKCLPSTPEASGKHLWLKKEN